ncbi:MAG: glutaminase, partial [Flavobacteriaceae bacterium]
MIDYQSILNEIQLVANNTLNKGEVASYIPELATIKADNFGIYLNQINGENYSVGDWDKPFSIQSISKVLSLSKALQLIDCNVWNRVDVEPSGNPFNFLSLLEQENGIPRNPLINSGAIVIADILVSKLENPKEDFIKYIRSLANDPTIDYNYKVAASEKEKGFKNYAIANMLKSYRNLNNDVEVVLDFYFHQCSIELNCEQITKVFYLFSNRGKCLQEKTHLTLSQVKRINALMLTCGFYDEAGEFAFTVGLPGKSGVGGGIVALLPNNFVIATWSPGLNKKGNSLLGMKALEQFTTKT